MIVQCCKCKRVKIDPTKDAISVAVGQPSWAVPIDPDTSQPGTITHRHCPRCAAKLKAQVDAMEAKK